MENLTFNEYQLVYNFFSFTFAAMAAGTLFSWLNLGSVSPSYRPAMVVTGLVTFIAAYHYLQIFISFDGAYNAIDGVVSMTGEAFNVTYRYVDWLLTVPLLLIELILVMKLSGSETVKRCVVLGSAAALMIILGYPGEIATDLGGRFVWGVAAMIPFLFIVFTLFSSLKDSIEAQPKEARDLVSSARWVVVITWSFYPIVYFLPNLGFDSSGVAVEIGYSIADIAAKVGFGVLIFMIARKKSEAEGYVAK
jgi:bacteriorhodopsin